MDRQVKVVIIVLILNFSIVPLVSGYYSHYLPRTHELIVEENATNGLEWGINVSSYSTGSYLLYKDGTYSTTGTSIIVSLPYGYYSYTVDAPRGYVTNSHVHNIHLTGARAIKPQAIRFLKLYPLSFTENGLLPNVTWSVSLSMSSATHENSTSNRSITFMEPAGTYNYSIDSVSGDSNEWYPLPIAPVSTGGYIRIILSPNGTIVPINFTSLDYAVTMYVTATAKVNTGNPNGIAIKMDGQEKYSSYSFQTSTYSSVIFHLPNGEYQYSAAHATGFNVLNGNGYIHVDRGPANKTIFYNYNYAS